MDEFFKRFDRRNELRPVKVEIIGAEIGAQEGGQHLPLAGITFESATGDVVITFAGQTAMDERHLTHIVNSVSSIIPTIGNDGKDGALDIESEDGTKTILIFEHFQELEASNSR